MACRSVKRAEIARARLLALLDADIALQKKQQTYDGHADLFKKNLEIVVHYVDLAMVRSILEFGVEIRAKYVYNVFSAFCACTLNTFPTDTHIFRTSSAMQALHLSLDWTGQCASGSS